MRLLRAADAQAMAVRQLGLDPDAVDLTATEAMAAALRRAAGFLCPCAAPTLVRAVRQAGDGIVSDIGAFKASIEATLDAIVGVGDLIEAREPAVDGSAAMLLYPAHPSFVMRGNSAALLIGVTPEHQSPLPEELERRVDYVNHVRRLDGAPGEDLRGTLKALGLLELSYDTWLKMPPPTDSDSMLKRFDALLDRAGPSGDMPGLTVIDPSLPVRYYPGRWREPRLLTGRFVGRRSQAYGADLWCYVDLRSGNPLRFVDLPSRGSRLRGCDEAWHLQMAIDARRGLPQQFRVRKGLNDSKVIELFSPVPMWAQRSLDAAGAPTPSAGCLSAYRMNASIEPEVDLLRNALWLSQAT